MSVYVDKFLHLSFAEKICEDVECGKGKCVANVSYPLEGFKCECEPGWKRTHHDDDDIDDHDEDKHLGFLPCVIPNCKLCIT